MNASSRRWGVAALLLVACGAGCDRDPDVRYGTVGGESLNGVSAFVQLLRDAGHETATRRWLSERMVGMHDVAVVFGHGFGRPDDTARELLGRFLAADGAQTLIFVIRDGDAAVDYWRTVATHAGLPEAKARQARRREREALAELRADLGVTFPARDEAVDEAADDDELPLGYGLAARAAAVPPPIEVDIGAAAGRPAVTARWELHRRLEPPRGTSPVWTHAGEPLLVESRGDDRIMLLASATPLLNGGLVDPGNRRLARELVGLLPTAARVVVVGSAEVLPQRDEKPGASAWRMLAVQPHPWIAAQALLAIGLFCWWRFPIFGRPRRESAGRPQDFGHHVEALGSLLRRSGDEGFARRRLAAWRHQGDRDS